MYRTVLPIRLEADEKELLWEKRHYLLASARALPRVLLAAPLGCWCSDALPELYALVELWREPSLAEMLQLLGPECVAPDASHITFNNTSIIYCMLFTRLILLCFPL